MSSVSASDSGGTRHLLVQAGDHLCALPLAAVRRVVRALQVAPLPGASAELLGLAEFAGEPLAILELARLVGAPPGPRPAFPVTVVAWAGPPGARELIGLAADAALEIVEIAASAVVPAEGGIVRGETAMGGRPLRVVDLEALGPKA